jgi:hypothetical protein
MAICDNIDYHIPRVIMPFWSALIVGYYTFEPVLVLNPIATHLELERKLGWNNYVTWSTNLHIDLVLNNL